MVLGRGRCGSRIEPAALGSQPAAVGGEGGLRKGLQGPGPSGLHLHRYVSNKTTNWWRSNTNTLLDLLFTVAENHRRHYSDCANSGTSVTAAVSEL